MTHRFFCRIVLPVSFTYLSQKGGPKSPKGKGKKSPKEPQSGSVSQGVSSGASSAVAVSAIACVGLVGAAVVAVTRRASMNKGYSMEAPPLDETSALLMA